ncbi:MAG: transposase zinc-binding domain-containing protein, partial [Bacteroidales bacterium]|nr:transposase zinc-binding domain-containing protein [Bacteroidales bacterium]
MSASPVELADIVRRFGQAYAERYHPNGHYRRVLRAIETCRTAALGGHVERCNDCGHIR